MGNIRSRMRSERKASCCCFTLAELESATGNLDDERIIGRGERNASCRRFTLAELQSATGNFDDERVIGKGGFGKVYKGVIDRGQSTVAIKRLSSTSNQGRKEFLVEIDTISKLRHQHLVPLLGYCDEGEEKILVYEYMEQGTLSNHLYKTNNNNIQSWEQRLEICIGVARGLDFLHAGRVIHRDVKSDNILLNGDMVAKVSDYGLCRTISNSISHITTEVKGTFGYFDLAYFYSKRLTKKSDVYAFGVVLFEVLCGRRPVDMSLDEERQSLSRWALSCIEEGKLDEIIDPNLRHNRQQIPSKSLEAFARVAKKCLNTHPKKRPTMADVVVSLERALSYLQQDDEEDRVVEEEDRVVEMGVQRSININGRSNSSIEDEMTETDYEEVVLAEQMQRLNMENRQLRVMLSHVTGDYTALQTETRQLREMLSQVTGDYTALQTDAVVTLIQQLQQQNDHNS